MGIRMQSSRSPLGWPTALTVSLLALLGPSLAPGHAQTTPPRVVVAGRPYAGMPAAQVLEGHVWGPVAPLVRLWGARLLGPDTGPRLEITTADGRRLVVEAGQPRLRVDDREVALPAAPRLGSGYLYAPLAPLFSALGAHVQEAPGQGLLVAAAVLRDVQFLRGPGGVAVRLVTSAPVNGTVRRLSDPERVYVDLPGLAIDRREGEQYVGAGGVWRLRWSQLDPVSLTARFVLDLREQQAARWVATPDGGRFEVGTLTGDELPFTPERPRVESVALSDQPVGGEQAVIRLSAPAEFTWEPGRRPYGLTFSFPEAVAGPLSSTGAPVALIRGAEVRPSADHGVEVAVRLGWALRCAVTTDATGQEITVSLRRGTLTGKRIVVDPGHGGKDPGAQARGLDEKDINLAVATALVARLTAAGAIAFLTRDSDIYVPLTERPLVATALEADAFVSVHCNAMERPNLNHGTEAYYYTPQSRLLADMLQDSLVAGLRRRDNGVRQRRFAVLWRSQQPCALVELMYLDWDAEGDLLRLPQVQHAAAESLFTALRGYFEGIPLTPEGAWPALQPPLLLATPGSRPPQPAVLNSAPVAGDRK